MTNVRDRTRRWHSVVLAIGVLVGVVACSSDEPAAPTTTPLATIPSDSTVHALSTEQTTSAATETETGGGIGSEGTESVAGTAPPVSRSTGETWVSSESPAPSSETTSSESPTGSREESTSSSATPPKSASTPIGSGSTSKTGGATSPKQSGSGELSAEEKADRAEIEKVWDRYWRILEKLTTYPEEDRKRIFSEVMVDPALAASIQKATEYDSEKLAVYGQVKHETRWGPAIDGSDDAVMADCQNQSSYGLADLKNKKLLTHGPTRANVQGTFARTASGWKVAAYVIVESKC